MKKLALLYTFLMFATASFAQWTVDKNMQIGMKALGTIKRSNFNLGSNLTTAFVSDEVQIRVTGEFSKPDVAPK